jgi:hypothetical protein
MARSCGCSYRRVIGIVVAHVMMPTIAVGAGDLSLYDMESQTELHGFDRQGAGSMDAYVLCMFASTTLRASSEVWRCTV